MSDKVKRRKALRYKNISGQRYGRLVAIEYIEHDKWNKAKWKCKCDCGNIIITQARYLKNKITKSCGCLQREIAANLKRKEKGIASFNSLFSSYERGAKFRNISFRLSEQIFAKLTKQKCYYCGEKPSQRYGQLKSNGYYIYNGIDRLNPRKGYIKSNCVSACKICNIAKQSLTKTEFLKLVNRIYGYQKEKKREKY